MILHTEILAPSVRLCPPSHSPPLSLVAAFCGPSLAGGGDGGGGGVVRRKPTESRTGATPRKAALHSARNPG
ncbi:hypothetical protein ZHAS_00009165 [Anopheles sinensis]|uniref:Uncharacterized protein n=1 Tax=Anopheles sinensis TaxID=74873 RepID=A0A084VU87_ANOSI|nr:hypothetical protein ZHAS_00009165 [Anopheles sinensis]